MMTNGIDDLKTEEADVDQSLNSLDKEDSRTEEDVNGSGDIEEHRSSGNNKRSKIMAFEETCEALQIAIEISGLFHDIPDQGQQTRNDTFENKDSTVDIPDGGIENLSEQMNFDANLQDIALLFESSASIAQGNVGMAIALARIFKKLESIEKRLNQYTSNKFFTAKRHIQEAFLKIKHQQMSEALCSLITSYNLLIEAIGLTCNPQQACECSKFMFFVKYLILTHDEEKEQFVLFENLRPEKKAEIADFIKLIIDELFKRLTELQRQTSWNFFETRQVLFNSCSDLRLGVYRC